MKAVIFDFDGVIVQSEIGWQEVEKDLFRSLIPTWSDADQQKMVGISVKDAHKFLTEEYDLKMSFEEYVRWYNATAPVVYDTAAPTKGVADLIRSLSEAGYTIGMASSAPRDWLKSSLSKYGIIDYFAAIVSADDVELSKPDPEIYRLAAERLRFDPSECIAIEDAEHGIASAKGAGMRCIAVSSHANMGQDISEADFVVDISEGFDVEEILNLLLGK